MGNSLGLRREGPVGYEGPPNHRHPEEDTESEVETVDESIPAPDAVSQLAQKNVELEKLSMMMKDIFPKIKKARVNKHATQFWISPFERRSCSEIRVKNNGVYSFSDPSAQRFPRFLHQLVNTTLRLSMCLLHANAKPEILEKHPEVEYLMRNLKFIKLKLIQCTRDNKIKVKIEENHGRRRNTSAPKFRPMYVTFMLLDHIQPSLFICGGEFMLNLTPPPEGAVASRSDADDEVQLAVGYYSRELDTNPNIVLEWCVTVKLGHNRTEQHPLIIEDL